MRLILVLGGSLGDYLPPLAIGREAVRRGHRVAAIGCERFLADLPDKDIDVRLTLSTAEQDEWRQRLQNKRLLTQRTWFRDFAVRGTKRLYEALRDLGSFDDAVVMAPRFPVGIGARIFCEQFGIPLAEFHVDPWPMCAGWTAWERQLFLLFHNAFIDHVVAPDVNAFRQSVGLPPVRSLCQWGDQQPQLLCGLYPEWIGRARRFDDRERRFLFAGFPVIQSLANMDLPSIAEDFLAAGPPPVLVSRPSWAEQQGNFLAETERALEKIGVRAIFTGSNRDVISTPSMLHAPFLPHAQLLPRISAFVHHGGSGTCAAGLAAGVPQLVVPRLPVQYDFGLRLRRLGVGQVMHRLWYRASRVTRAVSNLIDSSAVKDRCRELAEKLRHEADGATVTCDAMERLAARASADEIRRNCSEACPQQVMEQRRYTSPRLKCLGDRGLVCS